MLAEGINNDFPWELMIFCVVFLALELCSMMVFGESYARHTLRLLLDAIANIIHEFLSGDTPKLLCSLLVSSVILWNLIYDMWGIKSAFLKPSAYLPLIMAMCMAICLLFLTIFLFWLNVKVIVPWLHRALVASQPGSATVDRMHSAAGGRGLKSNTMTETQNLTRNPASLGRHKVFISYSHKDAKWLERLRTMVSPLIEGQQITLWDDTRIGEGKEWQAEIHEAIEQAKVAVLLVSDHFLASDYITKNELPPILDAANQGGLKILWVYVSECLYEGTPIEKYQAAHQPLRPLESLRSSKQKEALKAVCKAIGKAAQQ